MWKNLFSQDSLFYRFMSAVWDLIVLNVLWIITCIPVVTVGAATTALYAVVFSYVDKNDGNIVRNFFKEFIRNMKKATILWMIVLGIGMFMYVEIYLMSVMHGDVNGILAGVITGILTLVLVADVLLMLYIFPMQARYENTISGTLGRSVVFCFGYFGYTFQMMGCILLPLGIMMILGMITGRGLSWTYLFYIFLGVAATVFYLVKGPWKRLIIKIEPESQPQNGME